MRRMRLIRCLKGYTLADIGEWIGLSGNHIRLFEIGKRELRIFHIRKIAKILRTTVEELEKPLTKEEKEKYFNSNGSFKGFRAIQIKHKEEQSKIVKRNIIKACENQACPLNKDCYCENDVVKEGRGPCAGQNLVKPKPISLVWSGTY